MSKRSLILSVSQHALPDKISEAILKQVLKLPSSEEQTRTQPELRAHALTRSAARQASLLAGSLALPPGVLAWLTILPELMGVWRLQAQLVSDIAAVYGKRATLSREQMIYCLFKHVSAQLFRDVVVRVGERYLVKAASGAFFQAAAKTLGLKLAQKLIGRGASRLVPLIGAMGVGAYAYYDTTQVAKTAIALFSKEITLDANPEEHETASTTVAEASPGAR
jgi:hypothetical protein